MTINAAVAAGCRIDRQLITLLLQYTSWPASANVVLSDLLTQVGVYIVFLATHEYHQAMCARNVMSISLVMCVVHETSLCGVC